ncbi:MAG: hypothetical protein QOH68_3635 [Nocardioidaceae bacterium]|jgi:hypothetical protein|nr:hypothetical protein [Nocardioidaceae bacterium]
MGRTWLLRGVTVAVFAVLVGAWAVGVAELGDSSPPADTPNNPVSRDESAVSDRQHPTVLDKAKSRHTRDADATQEALAEPSPDTDEPTDVAPSTPGPTGTHTQDPSDSSPPSHPPSSPPSEPAEECTDLPGVIDCVLDPITGHP